MGNVQEQIAKARQLERARDYAGALDAFLAAGKKDGPHTADPAFWLAVGAAAERVDRIDSAEDAYLRAIDLLDGRGAANSALAVAGRLARAVGGAEAVVRQGEIALRLGYAPLARDAFLIALDRAAGNGASDAALQGLTATWHLLRERGMEKDADAVRQRVIAVDPDRDPLASAPSADTTPADALADGASGEAFGDAAAVDGTVGAPPSASADDFPTLAGDGLPSLSADLPPLSLDAEPLSGDDEPLSLDHDVPADPAQPHDAGSVASRLPPLARPNATSGEALADPQTEDFPTLAGDGLDSLAADLSSLSWGDHDAPITGESETRAGESVDEVSSPADHLPPLSDELAAEARPTSPTDDVPSSSEALPTFSREGEDESFLDAGDVDGEQDLPLLGGYAFGTVPDEAPPSSDESWHASDDLGPAHGETAPAAEETPPESVRAPDVTGAELAFPGADEPTDAGIGHGSAISDDIDWQIPDQLSAEGPGVTDRSSSRTEAPTADGTTGHAPAEDLAPSGDAEDLGLDWDFTSASAAPEESRVPDPSDDIILDPGLLPPSDAGFGDSLAGASDDLEITHPEEAGYGIGAPPPPPADTAKALPDGAVDVPADAADAAARPADDRPAGDPADRAGASDPEGLADADGFDDIAHTDGAPPSGTDDAAPQGAPGNVAGTGTGAADIADLRESARDAGDDEGRSGLLDRGESTHSTGAIGGEARDAVDNDGPFAETGGDGPSIAEEVAGLFAGLTSRLRGGGTGRRKDQADRLPPAEELDLDPISRAPAPDSQAAGDRGSFATGGDPWSAPADDSAPFDPGASAQSAEAESTDDASSRPPHESTDVSAGSGDPALADGSEPAPPAPDSDSPDALGGEPHLGSPLATPTETKRDPEPPASESIDGGDFIDLAALILGEDEDTGTRFQTGAAGDPTGDEDRDFAEILAIFRREVSQKIHPQDSSSHYDLGIAYKEMGLLDDAIAQLQLALRAGANPVATLEVIGECFIEKDECSLARRVLERALQVQDTTESDLVGVLYWLGRCEEILARPMEATAYYERVVAVDISFRDAAERLRGLSDATR